MKSVLLVVATPLAAAPALAQAELATPLVERFTGAEVAIQVLILAVPVVFFVVLDWMKGKRHADAMAASEKRYEGAVGKFVGLVEKNSETTERLAVALERLRDALVEDRGDFSELRGEFLTAVTESKTTLTEIRSAVLEVRAAQRDRST